MANGPCVTVNPAWLRPMAADWKMSSFAEAGAQRGASSMVSP